MTNPLDYKAVTNMYLYGSEDTPDDKASDALIRNKDVITSLSFSQADVMSTLGRFAVGAQFDLVKSFFNDIALAPNSTGYSKTSLLARYPTLEGKASLTIQQKNYADATDDYAERTYIWNNMNFTINKDTKFVVAADRTKWIENFSVSAFGKTASNGDPIFKDNFDFTSTSDNSIANSYLQEWVDPSGIGRKVDLNFTGTMPTKIYTQANYNADLAKIQTWTNPSYLTLYNSINDLSYKLWDSKVTRFLDDEDRVIMYGTEGNDSLSANSSDKINSYLEGYLSYGIVFVGGKGNDSMTGSSETKDKYVIDGGGNDTINDSGEGDKIEGFAGEAVEKGEGSGIYELNGAELQDVDGDLVIRRGSDVTYVRDWVDGDYGITFESKDKPDEDTAGAVGQMWNHPSPIALDINKSGAIETTSVTASKTYFDIDNDGFSERVQWLSGGDGWLARDLNANGKIDNQSELFGDGGGLKAYQKLAALNTNNAGTSANIINSADSAWNSLRVWVDSNSNGVSETAELKTLASLGITSLSLESAVGSLKSTFVMNGTTYNAQDIFVATDQMDSWYKGTASEITPLSLTLPRSRGYGDVKSLHYASSSSSTLTTKLQELDNLPISGLDSYYTKLSSVVEEWTGTSSVVRGSINQLVDARHVAIMEKFSGMGAGSYMRSFNITSGFTPEHFATLKDGYSKIMNELSVRFITQGPLANVFGNPTYSFSDDEMKFSISHTQILANALANAPTDLADKNVYWGEVARVLLTHAGDFGVITANMSALINQSAGFNVEIINLCDFNSLADSINGGVNNDTISAGAGNDTVWGWAGNDLIDGGTGNDSIAGGDGNDTIIGGIGSDLIYGGNGNDSISESAWSSDSIDNNTIYGEAGNDRIENNSNFAQLYGGIGDDTIIGGFGNETIYGGDGNDRLEGNGGLNLLYGDAGNDTLYGSSVSNSTIIGGLGADELRGAAGNETFRYARGDGDDVIFKASTATTNDVLELTNINLSEVTFSVASDSLFVSEPNSIKINITGGGSILLAKYLDGTNAGHISSLKFSNGTLMSSVQILQATAIVGNESNNVINGFSSNNVMFGFGGNDAISGNGGDDVIYGGAGNDTLRGGIGNDTIEGGDGNDNYRYVRGDGDDIIKDFGYSSTQDELRLENITRNEVSFISVDSDIDGTLDSIKLVVSGGGGSITLKDHLNQGSFNVVELLRFSDGTVMTAAQMLAATPVNGTAGDDILFGDSNNNNISGLSGNDQLIGGDGNDSLSGDDGNDSVWGDAGNDTIRGGNNNDYISGGIGDDFFNGDSGNDYLNGGEGNDRIFGGSGDDQIIGEQGNDSLVGDNGNDTIWGDDGNDTLNGSAGKDQMTGGAGIDTFLFTNVADNQAINADYIWDFTHAVDKINLQGLGFTRFDTDGGSTEAGELRFSAVGGITTILSDQNGFTFQLNGTFNSGTLTNSDFIW